LANIAINGPVSDEVRPNILGRTEPGSTNKRNVALLANRPVRRKNRLMEVFKRVVTSSTTSSPLEDDRKVGIGLGNIHNLSNAINGTRFERDVPDFRNPQTLNDFCSFLCTRDTSSDAESLDWKTLPAHLLQQRNWKPNWRGFIEGIERDANTCWDLCLNLCYLGAEGSRVVVSTLESSTWYPASKTEMTKPALTVVGVIPATMMGGLPRSRENGVSRWIVPSL
jgi:hypothetical protein